MQDSNSELEIRKPYPPAFLVVYAFQSLFTDLYLLVC